MGGNMLSCIEDNIFNPVAVEFVPPSTHVQEEKYRIACEHHRTMVEQLNEAQREVNELKKNKTKLKSKISDFVGNASDRKRKLATLERCKLSLADALEIKAEAKNELDQALKAQAAAVEEDKEKRKMLSKYLEEQKEKKLMEEERLKAQRKLEAERTTLAKEEHLREMREQRHTKEDMLNRAKEEAPIHPRTQTRRAPKVDAELAKFLDEADGITKSNGNIESFQTTTTAPNMPSPPTTPVQTITATTTVPKSLESSSPTETPGKEAIKQPGKELSSEEDANINEVSPQAPWRKVTKSSSLSDVDKSASQ